VSRFPNFLIIGAQKAATTFLHHRLAAHPAIFMPEDEIAYFEDPDYHETPLSQFQALFGCASPGQVIGIKRPSYLALPESAARMRRLIPGAKLIAVLRNPLDRAVSAYFHNIRYGVLPCVPVARGLCNLIEGKWEKSYPRSAEVIEFGYYARHLSVYLDLFPRSQLLVLLHEEIEADPDTQIRRALGFLGSTRRRRPS
jgi:Sulfotransferase domain